jgi:hypothetical protein
MNYQYRSIYGTVETSRYVERLAIGLKQFAPYS